MFLSPHQEKLVTFYLQSWDTFAFLGRIPIHIGPTPALTSQTMLDACIHNFFGVSILYRVTGGRTSRKVRKGCTVLRGTREMTEKYEYCSTVTRTFVQDCRYAMERLIYAFVSSNRDYFYSILHGLPWACKTDTAAKANC